MKRPLPGCEVDYWDKLDPETRRWLTQFNNEFHNTSFPKKKPMHRKKERRKLNNLRNASRRDAYAKWYKTPHPPNPGAYELKLEDAIDAVAPNVNLTDFLIKRAG